MTIASNRTQTNYSFSKINWIEYSQLGQRVLRYHLCNPFPMIWVWAYPDLQLILLVCSLILGTSADSEKEEDIVEWLREVGMPADYVNRLARMFQDIKVSFNQYIIRPAVLLKIPIPCVRNKNR